MAKRIDREMRARLTAWFVHFFKQRAETQAQFARFLGIGQGSVSDYLNGKTIGLDVLVKMSSKFRVSLDTLVDQWPPGHARRSANHE